MFLYIDVTLIWVALAERSKVNVDLWNLFEQTWYAPHTKCYTSCPKDISLLVLEKQILNVFTIYGHGGHFGHVTITICKNLAILSLGVFI